MSLLEDVFLEDEAGEAQELERIIEGDDYEEINRATSPNSDLDSEKEDEAEEDKRRVDPTQSKSKRVVKHPRFILNPARLTGPRGIQVIPEHFKDFKFKGKGHEREDLDLVLKKLEHWAYRLYPKFEFEDCLKKIETLGKKRPVMVHLHKIRNDQLATDEAIVQKDSSDDEDIPPPVEDEFDKLLQQQIELAQATPKPSSVKKPAYSSTPRHETITSSVPKAVSSPSISDDQRERMLRNRKLAEERRLAKLKNNTSNGDSLKNNIISRLDVVNEGSSVNTSRNSPDKEGNDNSEATIEIHISNIESDTAKDEQRESHATVESDTRDNLDRNLNDKSKDINTEINKSDNEIHMEINNECIKPNRDLNNDRTEHYDVCSNDISKELEKEVNNKVKENVGSISGDENVKLVGEEVMDVDFSEEY